MLMSFQSSAATMQVSAGEAAPRGAVWDLLIYCEIFLRGEISNFHLRHSICLQYPVQEPVALDPTHYVGEDVPTRLLYNHLITV